MIAAPFFDDDISDVFGGAPAPPRIVPAPVAAPQGTGEGDGAGDGDYDVPPREFIEICRKCRGTGRYSTLGKCFACKGVGKFVRKTSPESRVKARASREAKKVRDQEATLAAFAEQHPEVFAWIESSRGGFPFASAMHDAIIKYGSLTDRQLAACDRCIEGRKAKQAQHAERVATAPVVATDKLMASFDAALASGLKRPKMRFEGFTASLAPANSSNAGAVYLKDGGRYLGKIAAGKFQASRDCHSATASAIVTTMADPMSAAVAFGRRTGSCSCCGRELTDPQSVAAGIGPICARNYGL